MILSVGRQVTCAGHGDDSPVEGLGQRVELSVWLVFLQGVAQTSEYQHAHTDQGNVGYLTLTS